MPREIKITDAKDKNVMFQLVIVGAGANGSHFVRGLLQDIRTYSNKFKDHNFDITLVDADKVESKNLLNQLYTLEDTGNYKVDALADRYGDVYALEIKAVTEYCKDIEMLRRLFIRPNCSKRTKVIPILVGMVDNNKSRQLFHNFFYSDLVENLIWLDGAVEGVAVSDSVVMSPEEEYDINRSGFSGQIVCGLRWRGSVILEPVTVVYSNILEDASSSFPDESCGALIVNNPQRCATNKFAAQLANNFMNNLLHLGTIFYHALNFNAQLCVSRPVFITEEQVTRFETINQDQQV